MRRPLLSLVALTLIWFALWGSVSWANFLGGLGAATVAIWILPSRRQAGGLSFRPINAVRLAGYFLWRLTVATAIVAWEIVTPRDRTRPAIVSVPLATAHPTIIAGVANLVSLTPGTITIDVTMEPTTLFIHVLHFESTARTRADVSTLERYLVAAVQPRSAAEEEFADG
ncbi:MAG TPA: Na+/H+ antiporter subunit E [Acidimicrobiia bacterium]|nr:Na+/H+ antiporter subunit E [Acidimicrobiia bacterium]